jgi:type IV pilus assembly protein PilW
MMNHRPNSSHTRRAGAGSRGLTLIELMVSLVIGLVILAAASAMFVSSSRSRTEIDSSADVIENGRYGLDMLSRELSQTGFYGTLVAPTGTTVSLCSTDPTVWAASLAKVAVGLNNADADPACLSRKAGTDAIFVQRASTCTTADGAAACAEDANNGYLQVSECGDEYSVTPFVVARGNDASLVLKTKTCDTATTAPKRKLIRRIFYIASNDVLSYIDITTSGALNPVAVAENIEQMQIEYALDTDSDGTPDSFTPGPADWSQVIGVRVWLLARSSATSANTKNASTFQMSDTSVDVAAASANYKRRVYSTYIPFITPKSRRES